MGALDRRQAHKTNRFAASPPSRNNPTNQPPDRRPTDLPCPRATCARLPAHANQVEDTAAVGAEDSTTFSAEEKSVRILKGVRPAQSVRPVGHDIVKGASVMRAGEVIRAAEVCCVLF